MSSAAGSKQAAGIDRITREAYPASLREKIHRLTESLKRYSTNRNQSKECIFLNGMIEDHWELPLMRIKLSRQE